MKKNKITYSYIILQNIKEKFTRTLLLVFFIVSLVTTVVICSNLSLGVKRGIDSTVNRMGADIVLVPEGYVSSLQDALFLGEPCTVYFENKWMDEIKSLEEVKYITSQLFLATITDSACCDSAVQVIAFDPGSDFVIQPWISENLNTSLKDYEVVVGNDLNYEPGDEAIFYGEKFRVMGKLKKAGMGYDNSVFLNYTTAFDLAKKPIVKSYFSIGERENIASLISVKVNKGIDTEEFASELKKIYEKEGIKVFTSGKLIQGLSDNVTKITSISYIIGILLFLFTFVGLLSVFSLTINERRKEYGILRSLGASPVHIIKLIAGEAGIISIAGSLIGSMLAYVLLILFQNYIAVALKLPYLPLDLKSSLLVVAGCLILSFFTGILSSIFVAVKISRTQVCLLIKEND